MRGSRSCISWDFATWPSAILRQLSVLTRQSSTWRRLNNEGPRNRWGVQGLGHRPFFFAISFHLNPTPNPEHCVTRNMVPSASSDCKKMRKAPNNSSPPPTAEIFLFVPPYHVLLYRDALKGEYCHLGPRTSQLVDIRGGEMLSEAGQMGQLRRCTA